MSLKGYLNSITSDGKGEAGKQTEKVTSVKMSFEGELIESSKINNSYSKEWVESEVKKSSDYFKKEIYSTE